MSHLIKRASGLIEGHQAFFGTFLTGFFPYPLRLGARTPSCPYDATALHPSLHNAYAADMSRKFLKHEPHQAFGVS